MDVGLIVTLVFIASLVIFSRQLRAPRFKVAIPFLCALGAVLWIIDAFSLFKRSDMIVTKVLNVFFILFFIITSARGFARLGKKPVSEAPAPPPNN